MSRIAFVAPPFLGHLNPMAALASELARRGHAVVHIGIADAEGLAVERGFAFRPVGRSSHPAGHLSSLRRRMVSGGHPLGIRGVLRDVAASTDMLCRDLPGALRAEGADLLVCDGTEAAGWLVGRHLELPVVTVANALPLNREPSVPPPFTGWSYDPSPAGLKRNRGGYRVADWLMAGHAAVIERWAATWRLPARRRLDECLSDLAQISQTVAGFDYPRPEGPAHFHPVGPLRTGTRPPRSNPGRRQGYASLGTLQGGRAGLFRTLATGLVHAGLDPVIAHGGALHEAAIAAMPAGAAVHDFVDQDAVLARSAIAVLNGGLNTVMDALAAGVPILAVPIAFEQGAIAARIERAGVGRRMSRLLLGPGRVAGSVRRILDDPSMAEATGRMAVEIAAAGGTARAADIVERVIATGRPVRRDERDGTGMGCAA